MHPEHAASCLSQPGKARTVGSASRLISRELCLATTGEAKGIKVVPAFAGCALSMSSQTQGMEALPDTS